MTFLVFICASICSLVMYQVLAATITPSTITVTPEICPCPADGSDEQCSIEQMFGSLQYWGDSNRCVANELKASVHIWRVPYTDRSYMFNYIRQCGTNNPLTDLFINGSNSCGLQRCCVTCNDCGTKLYDILEQEGPVILKSQMALLNGNLGPVKLIIYCAPNAAETPIGTQQVFVTFEQDKSCAITENVTKSIHLTTSSSTLLLKGNDASSPTTGYKVELSLVISGACVLTVLISCVGINYAVSRVYKIKPIT